MQVPNQAPSTVSSFIPLSGDTNWPPVNIARSCNIAVLSSPKDGALTAATDRVPLTLLTTNPAKASPSISSATISKGLPAAIAYSNTLTISLRLDTFLS